MWDISKKLWDTGYEAQNFRDMGYEVQKKWDMGYGDPLYTPPRRGGVEKCCLSTTEANSFCQLYVCVMEKI